MGLLKSDYANVSNQFFAMNISFMNLCRTCLTQKESFSYCIFDNVSAETFEFCTSISVKNEEDLPKKICNTCFELLTKYSEFKQTCIESHNTLLNYNKSIKPESEVKNHINNTIEVEFENTETKNEDLKIKDELLHEVYCEDLALSDCIDPDDYNVSVGDLKKENEVMVAEPTQTESKQACEMCGKLFKYSKCLEAHKKKHFIHNNDTNDNPDFNRSYKCKKCNKTFARSSNLQRHEESTHKVVPLSSMSCAQCGRVYASKSSLKHHEKMHRAKNEHICDICGKKMSTYITLKVHLETHANREKGLTCEHCGKKFFNNKTLISHRSTIHSGTQYICALCGFSFKAKYSLAKHLFIHEGKKPYKCDFCEKYFRSSGSLKEHIRIHTGERPYSCSFCPKRFLSNRRLQDHHKTHTGEKPHKCNFCEQRFVQKSSLNRHMKVHDSV